MSTEATMNQKELFGAFGCVLRNGMTLCSMMLRSSIPNQQPEESEESQVIESDPLDIQVSSSDIEDSLRFGTLGAALKALVSGKEPKTEYDIPMLLEAATRSIESGMLGLESKQDYHITIIDDDHPVKANQVITDDVVVILDTDVTVKKISADVIFMFGGNLRADIVESAKHVLINAETVDVRKFRAANGVIAVDDINFRSFEYTNCQVFCGAPINVNGVPHSPISVHSEKAFDLKRASTSLREFLDVLMKLVDDNEKMEPLHKRTRSISIQPFGLIRESQTKKEAPAAQPAEQTAAPEENVETNVEGMARPEPMASVLRFGQAFLTDEEWNVIENLSNSHLKNALSGLNTAGFALGNTKKELIAQLRTVEKILPDGSIFLRKVITDLKNKDGVDPEDGKDPSTEE